MFAVAFDAIKRELIGSPVRIIAGVRGLGPRNAWFGFSTSGTLVYVPDVGTDVTPAWVDRRGNASPLSLRPGGTSSPWSRLMVNVSRCRCGEEPTMSEVISGCMNSAAAR